MKPRDRKSLTVDVVERRRIYFRLKQKVFDRGRLEWGIIVALTNEGCLLRRSAWKDGVWNIDRWFVEYAHVRPYRDGTRYL